MRDAESALSALGALQALGLHLAVDDFGTGYSSLAYLERLPVEALKIDRSFVEGVGVRKDSTAIVGAVVGLAHALRLTTVAEGIETARAVPTAAGAGLRGGPGLPVRAGAAARGLRSRPASRVRPSPPPRRGPARPAGGGQPSHRRVTEPPRSRLKPRRRRRTRRRHPLRRRRRFSWHEKHTNPLTTPALSCSSQLAGSPQSKHLRSDRSGSWVIRIHTNVEIGAPGFAPRARSAAQDDLTYSRLFGYSSHPHGIRRDHVGRFPAPSRPR